MEQMSGLDASFLYLETPAMHMHVCATIVFDPATVPGGWSFAHTRDVLAERVAGLPQFRRRLASVPLGLHHPVWVDEPGFDLDYHLRRIGCPAPGGTKELAEVTADIAGRKLDRTKPLWEAWVIEGLAGGHHALVLKMHHATIDGVSGANLMMHLFDLTPDPAPLESQPWRPEPAPSETTLVRYALGEWARHPMRLARVLPQTARAVAGLVAIRRGRESGGGMPTPFTAPRLAFNGALTAHRTVALTNVPLADLKAVKNALGCTLNDVVLAVVAGALRQWLQGRGELPAAPLLAIVPVSVHGEPASGPGVNRISSLFTSLATDIDDPVERLRAISETNRNAKEEHNAVGAEMLQGWAEFAAPLTFSLAARIYTGIGLADRHPVVYNLVVSNVPGPPMPLYLAGAEIVGLYPLGPIFEGIGLNVTVLSYRDTVGFGLIACREQMPDLDEVAAAVSGALAELAGAAGLERPAKPVTRAQSRRRTAKTA